MEIETDSLEIRLTAHEAVSTVRALTQAIGSMAFWSISPAHPWRNVEFWAARATLNDTVQAYTQIMFVIRENAHKLNIVPEFERDNAFADEEWDIISSITSADNWEGVELHNHRSCRGCRLLTSH